MGVAVNLLVPLLRCIPQLSICQCCLIRDVGTNDFMDPHNLAQ